MKGFTPPRNFPVTCGHGTPEPAWLPRVQAKVGRGTGGDSWGSSWVGQSEQVSREVPPTQVTPGPCRKLWNFWALTGGRSGMAPHPKPHWGIQGQSLPHHSCVGHLQPCSNTHPPCAALALSASGNPHPHQCGPTQGLHLLIGSAPPSDQHHVEAGEADDRDEEEASHTHDSHAGPLRPTAVGEDTEQVPADKLPPPPREGHPPCGDSQAADPPL